MRRKELKTLAEKIARYEYMAQNAPNENVQRQAELEIMKLCGSVDSMEDMLAIDELVMKILEKK
jgi:hypothetical protein